MQLCRWAKWSGSAQREARDVCVERRAEVRRRPPHDKMAGKCGCRGWASAVLQSGAKAWPRGSEVAEIRLAAGFRQGEGRSARSRIQGWRAGHPWLSKQRWGQCSVVTRVRPWASLTRSMALVSRPPKACQHTTSPHLSLFISNPQAISETEQVLKKHRERQEGHCFPPEVHIQAQASCCPRPSAAGGKHAAIITVSRVKSTLLQSRSAEIYTQVISTRL